ncbi:hypothetical protein F4808DRAFT_424082 [Astrocystis sublimbata]|nr:hypothetical protein F4808DRAFT_424082 [Astrocystis sublimbata]
MSNAEAPQKMQLETLSYERLKARDTVEAEKLVRVLSHQGLFFLDLSGPNTKQQLADLLPVIHAQRQFFTQPPEKKAPYLSNSDYHGYDCVDEICVQRLKLPREDQIRGKLDLPKDLQPVGDQLETVASFNDAILRDLSRLLCQTLDPAIPATVVEGMKGPGISHMCLGSATAPVGTSLMPSHIDSDLLTLTYYDEPFLEVQDRETQEWKAVDVCDNHPIVNVGGTFQKLSNGQLYTPWHRVKQSPRPIDLVMYDLYAPDL